MAKNNLSPLAYNIEIGYNERLVVTGCVNFGYVDEVTRIGVKLIDSLNEVNVDISGITEFNSGTLAMLLEWQKIALSSQKKIHFYNAPKPLLDLGRVYGLDTILNFEHSSYSGKT
jgi:ABC-type transporter Mla MlaB component